MKAKQDKQSEKRSSKTTSVSTSGLAKQTAHFDRFSSKYDSIARTTKYSFDMDMMERLLDIREGQKILDLGTGTGRTVVELLIRSSGKINVYGIDASLKMIENARQKVKEMGYAKKVFFDQGDILHLPYQNSFFDAVVCSYVLHHIPFQKRVEALSEARRVLKPRGRLLILEVGKNHYRKQLEALHGRRRFANPRFTQEELEELVKKVGFELTSSILHHYLQKVSVDFLIGYFLIQGIVSENATQLIDSFRKKYESFETPINIVGERLIVLAVS